MYDVKIKPPGPSKYIPGDLVGCVRNDDLCDVFVYLEPRSWMQRIHDALRASFTDDNCIARIKKNEVAMVIAAVSKHEKVNLGEAIGHGTNGVGTIEATDAWLYIMTPDGLVGYVLENQVKKC